MTWNTPAHFVLVFNHTVSKVKSFKDSKVCRQLSRDRVYEINTISISKMKSKYLARKISLSSSLCLNLSPKQRRCRVAIENVLQKNSGQNHRLNISQFSLYPLKLTSS